MNFPPGEERNFFEKLFGWRRRGRLQLSANDPGAANFVMQSSLLVRPEDHKEPETQYQS